LALPLLRDPPPILSSLRTEKGDEIPMPMLPGRGSVRRPRLMGSPKLVQRCAINTSQHHSRSALQ
jgi:hypothetical protein